MGEASDLPPNLVSRYDRTPVGRIHSVTSFGEPAGRPCVICVHGAALSYRYMVPTAERLDGAFYVLVPDQPGFGKSVKPLHALTFDEIADSLAGWMDVVGVDRAALLGNSVGCQLIVSFALRHPERIDRAVLQGPTCDPQARTFRQQFLRWRRNGQNEHRPGKRQIVVRDYWECGPWRMFQTIRYSLKQRIEELLPHMRCPTLVVRGEQDPIVPQQWAEEVTRLLPDGELIVLEGVAHTANYEWPDELVQAVTPFLQETQPASPVPNGPPAGV